uniref:Serpin 6 n=1 Tax=Philodina roseola TaxID=96448 RepID=B6S316_PHIRO|nr:serpin 6 precursor [Philodina roseola]
MESKICEYVQRRLSEIAISEQLSKENSTKETNESLSTSNCHLTLAQNNNHLLSDNSNTFKYRAERTLTFENVLIGDSTLKYLDPARFDAERKTYIKTMRGKRIAQALEFIQTTRFIGTKKIMFHIGANDLNRDKLSEQEVSEQMKELIVTTKTVSPQSDVYISLIFARQANDESRMKTDKLNYLLQAMASPELKVYVINHSNISHDIRGCFEDSTHLSKAKGTILFEENIKKAMGLKKSPSHSRLTTISPNQTKLPSAPTRLPLGFKYSQTHFNGYNLNNNALMNPTNLVNMNMINANALSAYLSFLANGFRS